jgi:hypothetical protein
VGLARVGPAAPDTGDSGRVPFQRPLGAKGTSHVLHHRIRGCDRRPRRRRYTQGWDWTGFEGNTLFDWLKLIFLPVVIPLVVIPLVLGLRRSSESE